MMTTQLGAPRVAVIATSPLLTRRLTLPTPTMSAVRTTGGASDNKHNSNSCKIWNPIRND